MVSTLFTDLLECDHPLQLAGMGGVSSVELTAAISTAGGLGMIGGAGVPADMLLKMLEEIAASTSGPFGTNFLMPFVDRTAVEVAAKRSRVVEFFYGDPDPSIVDLVHGGGALASWQIGSVDEAVAAADAGCDLIVAQGTEAGGHIRGRQPLLTLLTTLPAMHVPIIAAGGIGTAADVTRILGAGASAVRIGTRFVASLESAAHDDYVRALINGSAKDTVITDEFAYGWPDAPARVLRSSLDAAREAEEVVATVGDQRWPVPRFSTMPPTKGVSGNVAAMPHYAGFSVDAVHERMPAAAIVAELMSEI